tara:strand:+ start:2533 stop:4263 length:1731 start_codon:yes stop_codon:yes gene_type:complete
MTFLNDLNRDIVDTYKNLNDMNETLAMTLQSSTKWNIASRLLSGTGLWSVQNRVRALISIVGEYQSGQRKQLEEQQKQAELMNNLAERTQNLRNAQEAFVNSIGHNSQAMEQYNENLRIGIRQQELLAATHAVGSTEYITAQNNLSVLNQTLNDNVALLEQSGSAMEERQRIMDHYNMTENEANLLIGYRLQAMEQAADAQDLLLRGTEEYRELQGQLILQQYEYNDQVDHLDDQIDMYRAMARNEGTFFGRGGSVEGQQYAALAEQARMQKLALKQQMVRTKLAMAWQKLGQKARQIWNIVRMAGSIFKKALFWIPVLTLFLAVTFKFLRDFWPFISGAWDKFYAQYQNTNETIGTWLGILGDMWEGVKALFIHIFEGNLLKAFTEGLWPILLGVMRIGLKGFILTAGILGTLLVATIWYVVDIIIGWYSILWGDFDRFGETLTKIGTIVTMIAMLVAFIQYYTGALALQWGTIGLALMGGVAAMAIGGMFAKGGVTSKSGTFLVGEEGPELVNLPGNSRIHNNRQTRGMTGNTINVHVNGRVGASDQEIRDIARKVGAQINREINRTTSSGTRM